MIVVTFFWKPQFSAFLLFMLLALWSRVPCMLSPFTKDFDMVDFFTVIIAINLNGFLAGTFGALSLMFSRIFGPTEYTLYTVKDSIAFFVSGMLTPIIYAISNQNLLITLYSFTVSRYILYALLTFLIEPDLILTELVFLAAGVPVAYFSNTFFEIFLGDYASSIISEGLFIAPELLFLPALVLVLPFIIKKIKPYLEEKNS